MNNEREKMILSFGLVGIVIFGVIALLILTYFAYGLDYFINEIKTLVGFTIGLCIILFIFMLVHNFCCKVGSIYYDIKVYYNKKIKVK